ncbi:hypothetical protein EYM_01780 [Ignicoccus islandicus DSM 13165]|uniref:CRISPR-associated protein Cmr3 n=1 Tax=Ignicoccus islandicus DSM 13165 TaxID=940295 RepID=A0A0U3FQS1_9CREN|nr:hypothetical protein [Ignicoccus islandicus]ALU12247.1 hypothetical protein EYM_01780 [Ignicoccus islandicus DSM 13165]
MIVLEPLSFVSFRKPGPFGITQRGPLSTSSTYFMKTTTLIGALAYLAYTQNVECSNKEGLFEATRECLRRCFRGNLRGPYVVCKDQPSLFFAEEKLLDLNILFERWDDIRVDLAMLLNGKVVLKRKKKGLIEHYLSDEERDCIPKIFEKHATGKTRRKLISHQFSNKLQKFSKNSEFIFVRERLYARGLKFFLEVNEFNEQCLYDTLIPLGGDGGLAKVEIVTGNPIEENLRKLWGNECWETCKGKRSVVVVISPLILESSSNSKCDYKDYKCHFQEILEVEEIAPLYDRYSVKAYPLGWDLRKDRPRPFVPTVTPGSAVVGTLKKSPRDVYWEGVGLFKDIGFGTVIPLPFD